MEKTTKSGGPPLLPLPWLWPAVSAAQLIEREAAFVAEEIKLHSEPPPEPATANRIMLDLRTMRLRDYSPHEADAPPVIVDAPYAGHSAMIADYHRGQSLIETLLANGVRRPFLTDWKSATDDMKDLDIDQYLAELNVCVDDLGGRVVLVGLCQGGWMSAMYAARFPDKVAGLVLAGSPIDTDAGDGALKRMVHGLPAAFYQGLVAGDGGRMLGTTMLRGWKGMNPAEHYFLDHIDLFEHIDDPVYLSKKETFERWYENPLDLPGRWYLQAINQLFRENRLAKGQFVALGRKLDLRAVTCPLYLLAGEADDITPREQVFNAAKLVGTARSQIEQNLAPGGHIGLFMGSRTLSETWPGIARWIAGICERTPTKLPSRSPV